MKTVRAGNQFAFVAYSSQADQVVIAFRGTDDISTDWYLNNLVMTKVRPEWLPFSPDPGFVHQGFDRAYRDLRPLVQATVAALNAVAAAEWMSRDLRAQYVVVPSGDPDLPDAWYRLGFGQQQAHAIRAPLLTVRSGEHVVVRVARRDDIAMLARLDLVLPEHQGLAPTFSAGLTGTYAEALAEWEECFDDQEFQVLVAEHDGQVVGSAVGCALEHSTSHTGPARPENAGFLGFAAVLPEARGLGAGRALGEAVLGWSREAGFDSVVTDWRVTNLLSSRTWTALGWRPTFLRLHRLIGY